MWQEWCPYLVSIGRSTRADGRTWMSTAPPTAPLRVGQGSVLVSDNANGRGRSTVAAVRALAAGGYRPVVAVTGGRSAAAASRSSAGRVWLPAADAPEFRSA